MVKLFNCSCISLTHPPLNIERGAIKVPSLLVEKGFRDESKLLLPLTQS